MPSSFAGESYRGWEIAVGRVGIHGGYRATAGIRTAPSTRGRDFDRRSDETIATVPFGGKGAMSKALAEARRLIDARLDGPNAEE